MTAARQQRKSPNHATTLWLAAGLWLAFAMPAPAAPAMADNGPVVVNANTGLAISGFDPVAYFTEAAPKPGKPDIELTLAGNVWRFISVGNRAAFAEHPEVYTPRFGGYDPVAVARGVSVAGHPLLWSVVGQRVYLFYNAQARSAFIADPGRYIDAAERKWPEVAHTLAR
jgi:hypothetical protein